MVGPVVSWRGPFLEAAFQASTSLIIVAGFLFTLVMIGVYQNVPIMIALPILAALTFYALWMRSRMRDIWHSARTVVPRRAAELVPLVEKALREGGLEPRARRDARPGWATLDLKGGMNVTLADSRRGAILYVGPYLRETAAEAERIKSLVTNPLLGFGER